MKTITQYIHEQKYNDLISEKFCDVIYEDIINESFKSTLIQKLAAKISKAEATRNKKEIENAQRLDKEYGGSHKPKITNFASIFGPVKVFNKYRRSEYNIARGLKWSEITDEQFILFKGIKEGIDKNLVKAIKQTCSHKLKANFIVCDQDTDNIRFFIRGYNTDDTMAADIFFFSFDRPNNWGGITPGGVHKMDRQKYSYKFRSLKADEIIEEIQGCDVYMLKITDDMIEDYKVLRTNRKESQKGVINYDKDSLNELLKNQKARYKALVEKIKADKLMNNSDNLFEDINKINQEVQDLYRQIVDNPDCFDNYYSLGNLMSYVTNAYEYFFKYIDNKKEGDNQKELYVRKYGKTYNGDSYYDQSAQDNINYCKERLDKIRKEIDNIKAKIK